MIAWFKPVKKSMTLLTFVPGRCGNIRGVLFDFIGAMAVLLWFWARESERGMQG